MKAIDDLKAFLKTKADQNGDGKVSVADVNFALDHAAGAASVKFWIGAAIGCVIGIALKAWVF